MSTTIQPIEACRPTDSARLNLARLRIEDGIALETVFQRVTETAAEILQVERVGVWLLVDEQRALRCVDLYELSKAAHSAGTTLQTAEFPDYFAAIDRRKTVPAEDAMRDPRTSGLAEAYLIPLGIISMLDAPIYVAGEVMGILCHEHIGVPREWTTEERDFAGSMADLLALKIQSAQAEELRETLRMQAEQLNEGRRMTALIETAAGIGHDFNNILHVMLAGAELIAADRDLPPALVEVTRQMTSAGVRGQALARELMEFARPGPRASRVIRPSEIVAELLEILQAAAGARHTVELEIRSRSGRVLIDPLQLERVLLNLVINARDAMADGGEIRVNVDTQTDSTSASGQFVVVTVSDAGEGIPPAVLARIFDPFFTTKPRGRGTGVGLAVVHHVVSYAGGVVRVESIVGQGTTFRVYLPRVSST